MACSRRAQVSRTPARRAATKKPDGSSVLTDLSHPDPPPRSQLELLQSQLAAIDAWNRARRACEEAEASVDMTREMRLDVSRRMEARRREQAAVVARADAHLRASGTVVAKNAAPRAVLAHRSTWLRDKVAARLTDSGVTVVASLEDGADAAGVVVVEQPDLVLVEDRLPTLPGQELVRRVRSFSPRTLVGVHVLDGGAVAPFMDAGAQAVFTRRIPPVEIADELLTCLKAGGRAGSLI